MDSRFFSSTDCTQVLEKIRQAKPDVVLMDNKIAPEGGIVATRLIKSDNETSSIPVVYFSANINVDVLSREAGADFVLQKPFNIWELEQVIERATSPNQDNADKN
ncbi:MAG: response regulator [Chitinophagaceae bacterium]|nr:response regulator [Chitinophagaceae bacterium]